MSEFPKMVYGQDGSTRTVLDATDEREAALAGFGSDPSGHYARAQPMLVPPVQTGQDEFIEAVALRVIDLLDARERDASPALDRPRRGRPPNSARAPAPQET